jgi:hypothetical protein
MSRNLLHITKLDDFKNWLTQNGHEYRTGRGMWEVIQISIPDNQWACIYERNDMPEHYTVDRRIDKLVRQFLKYRKQYLRKEEK